MKIWIPTLRCGSGADVYFASLAENLTDAGHEVTLSWFSHAFEPCPFPLAGVRAPFGTEIVHSNSWHGFAFKQRGIPLVVSLLHNVHDPAFAAFTTRAQRAYHGTVIRTYERWSLARADLAVAISDYTLSSYAQSFTLPRTVRVYPSVDTRRFTPGTDMARRPAPPYRLLFIGNNSRRKGFDLLQEVMGRLGDGYVLRYTSGNRRLPGRLPPNMVNIGRLTWEGLLAEYRQCDAVLYPSRYEGFGYVVAEGMACGKPVITCGGTSIDEITDECVVGTLTASSNVDGLAEMIRRATKNPPTCSDRNVMRSHVVSKFSPVEQTNRHIEAYHFVIDHA